MIYLGQVKNLMYITVFDVSILKYRTSVLQYHNNYYFFICNSMMSIKSADISSIRHA